MNTENAPAECSGATDCYAAKGWVVETTERHALGCGFFWRPGHSGNRFYGAVCGMWPLAKAKIFHKKNAAFAACVELKRTEGGGYGCAMFRVREVTLNVGTCVYPPSESA
jgi:hypothetical protein